jgi:WD repeat-containing protein 59
MNKEPSTAFESETFGQDVSFKLEQPVGSMSISPCGRDVVLASREGLHIIDLDSPWDPPRYLAHHTSWEVADVQWSPFGARDNWVASTSNQKALVWNLDAPASDSIEFVLHGHTRAITDINFSAHDPNVLATCAVDSFVHCWDLRTPQRPAISFSDWFAGATQVKWSRQDSSVIASSHDKYLRIWDQRKGAYPVRSIEAHGTKIYGVDWNRFYSNKIVTCSLDKTVKFWDIENLEDVPERIIETPFPVWRARHTPFGWGLLAMPQRSNGDLHMYNRRPSEEDKLRSGPVPPVKIFPGHKGQVKEFLWRARGNIESGIDHRDFQLVSWGTDRELRLHRIDPETNSSIGYEKGVSKTQRLNFTRRGARYRTFRNEPTESSSPASNVSKLDSPSTTQLSFKFRHRTNTSVGMNKAVPRFRGWVQGGGARAGVGMHGRSTAQHELNPIAWMKNVKINSSWNQETLADEITQVGEQFSKVDFEVVDIQARRATISMHGPWGDQHTPTYIRVEMKFAKTYPSEGSIAFLLQKTSSMTPLLHQNLLTDMQAIAKAYEKRRKGCLEAVLRYLLREQSKDDLVSWILDESIMDSKLLTIGLEGDVSSSDDEDERLDNANGPSGLRNPPDILNANARVPVAKGCGALWSDSGKLVCFFPAKAKEPASFFDQLDPKDQDHLRAGNYGGFPHLGASSLLSKSRTGHGTVDADDDTDDSEATSTSSSSSSDSVDILNSMPAGFLPKKAWHLTASGLQRFRSANHSNHSTNDLRQTGSTLHKLLNFVAIRSYDDLIPSRRALALEYKVFGNGPDICEYNAAVALKAGLDEIASVWRLAQMILKDGLPLECHRDLKNGVDIITLARKASVLRRKNSGRDLSYDVESQPRKLATSGRVRWGNSPMGPGYLIGKLMSHFEVTGDMQMLAMLSCVFAEPKAGQVEDIETLLRPHKRHELSMQIKAPAFSVDYFPNLEVARSIVDSTTSFKTSYAASARPSLYANSNAVSPNLATNNSPESGEPNSETTNSLRNRTSIRAHDMRHAPKLSHMAYAEAISSGPPSPRSATISLSTSPEDSRLSRRSNSGLTFSFSRSSLTALAQAYSDFPPGNSMGSGIASSIKKYSPSGSLTPGNWNTTAIFGGSGSAKTGSSGPSNEELKASHSFASTSYSGSKQKRGSDLHENSRNSITSLSKASINAVRSRPGKTTTVLQVNFQVSLHNQNQFDNEGYASVALLCPKLEWKFKSYRASYAYLLGSWELYPQMAEVLKFDGLTSYFVDSESHNDHDHGEEENELKIGNARRRRTFIEASRIEAAEKKGLEVRQNCSDCGKALTAIEKNGIPFGWHCATPGCASSVQKKSTRLFCTICNKVIEGLMVPCLNCGHATCHVCALGWFGSSFDSLESVPPVESPSETMETSCPSGCGCECLKHEYVSAPWPVELEVETMPRIETLSRQKSHQSVRSERLMSQHGPDPAIAALLSLTRSRSISMAKGSTKTGGSHEQSSATDQSEANSDDEPDPWARSKYSSLGRGVGGGLSRGLSTKSSDATIRKSSGR